jgi:putative protease
MQSRNPPDKDSNRDKPARNMELVCPAGSFPALKAAVDNGADAVYIGYRGPSNARNFPGLNFDDGAARRALAYARDAGAKLFVALNTNPSPDNWEDVCRVADMAARLEPDALIVADLGLLRYLSQRHPYQRLHLSVQASATNYESINFYVRQFGVARVVLPRVLSLQQIYNIAKRSNAEIEVFGFGSLCVMVEGRCQLSSYVTGESPNLNGVCSPAKAVNWEEHAGERRVRLNGVLIDVYPDGENAGYPTLCKGRFEVDGHTYYALEEPTALNVIDILPRLDAAGVAAIKVEGRQRSPVYVAQVTHVLRSALDAYAEDGNDYLPSREWLNVLDNLSEGGCHTLGAYHRPWH